MTTTCTRRSPGRPLCLTRLVLALPVLTLGIGLAATESAAATTSGHLCDGQDAECASCQKGPSPAGAKVLEHGCVRSGDPHRVSGWAKPSRNPRDSFGYVGGSTAWRGEPRMADEGTWGRDYAGLFFRSRVWLGWLHGRPTRQAGGSYKTDGPHFLSK